MSTYAQTCFAVFIISPPTPQFLRMQKTSPRIGLEQSKPVVLYVRMYIRGHFKIWVSSGSIFKIGNFFSRDILKLRGIPRMIPPVLLAYSAIWNSSNKYVWAILSPMYALECFLRIFLYHKKSTIFLITPLLWKYS